MMTQTLVVPFPDEWGFVELPKPQQTLFQLSYYKIYFLCAHRHKNLTKDLHKFLRWIQRKGVSWKHHFTYLYYANITCAQNANFGPWRSSPAQPFLIQTPSTTASPRWTCLWLLLVSPRCWCWCLRLLPKNKTIQLSGAVGLLTALPLLRKKRSHAFGQMKLWNPSLRHLRILE